LSLGDILREKFEEPVFVLIITADGGFVYPPDDDVV
jgi:hypothetical protein